MLKKLALFAALAAMLFALALPVLAAETRVDVYQGASLVKSVVFVVGQAEYYVNGQTPGVKMDVAPYIDQDRTFVPVRYLGYALGVKEKDVAWDNALQKASLTLPPNKVEMTIGEKRIITNGQAKEIDVAPQLKSDRTFLPARFVAEGLGYTVKWEQDGGRDYVICWPQGEPEPDISAVKQYVNSLPQQPANPPVNPPNNPPANSGDEIYNNAKPFEGQPVDKSKFTSYVGPDGKMGGLPFEFNQPGASIQYVTVDDLKPNGIRLGDHKNGYKVILDMQVTKEKVYIKQFATWQTPVRIVLAEGNMVGRIRENPLKKFTENPFTYGYDVYWEGADWGAPPLDISQVSHIMVMYDNEILAIANPLYQGGGSK